MRTSPRGVDLIRTFEGVRTKVYKDSAGLDTIGIGHLVKPGESFPNGITETQAEDMLRRDLVDAEAAIGALVKVMLSQNEFDALVSFAFNLGAGNLRGSTLLKTLNAGDRKGAAAEFGKWTHAGGKVVAGLVKRRAAERKLFEEA